MAKQTTLPEIIHPELEFELPLKKNKEGFYHVLPNTKHIGGKNCLRVLASSKVFIGYVYLIRIKDTTTYKIGVSITPKKRLANISSILPFDLEVLALNKVNNPYKVEQDLIDMFSSKIIKNEWFNLDINDAKFIMITLHNKEVERCQHQ